MYLLDALPPASGVALGAGAIFFVAFAIAGFIVFKLLKKTVKMAVRMAIVGVILLIAVVGSISFWWLGTSKTPTPQRPRTSQTK
jgi:hypothetical protein